MLRIKVSDARVRDPGVSKHREGDRKGDEKRIELDRGRDPGRARPSRPAGDRQSGQCANICTSLNSNARSTW